MTRQKVMRRIREKARIFSRNLIKCIINKIRLTIVIITGKLKIRLVRKTKGRHKTVRRYSYSGVMELRRTLLCVISMIWDIREIQCNLLFRYFVDFFKRRKPYSYNSYYKCKIYK